MAVKTSQTLDMYLWIYEALQIGILNLQFRIALRAEVEFKCNCYNNDQGQWFIKRKTCSETIEIFLKERDSVASIYPQDFRLSKSQCVCYFK